MSKPKIVAVGGATGSGNTNLILQTLLNKENSEDVLLIECGPGPTATTFLWEHVSCGGYIGGGWSLFCVCMDGEDLKICLERFASKFSLFLIHTRNDPETHSTALSVADWYLVTFASGDADYLDWEKDNVLEARETNPNLQAFGVLSRVPSGSVHEDDITLLALRACKFDLAPVRLSCLPEYPLAIQAGVSLKHLAGDTSVAQAEVRALIDWLWRDLDSGFIPVGDTTSQSVDV